MHGDSCDDRAKHDGPSYSVTRHITSCGSGRATADRALETTLESACSSHWPWRGEEPSREADGKQIPLPARPERILWYRYAS
jgi:hypothetical protein